MRILIDCTQITRAKAGVGVYAKNMLEQLVSLSANIHFFLLVQDDDHDLYLEGPNVTLTKVAARIFRKLPCRLVLEQCYIPYLVRRLQIDVVHSLHYSFPLISSGAKRVVTVHDLTSVLMPNVHLKSKLVYFRVFLRLSQRLANAIICVSESTKRDYLKFYPRSPASCFVTPLACEARFNPHIPEHDVEIVRSKYKITSPYVLFIGTLEPRKNLSRLVQAFVTFSAKFPQYSLVVAGKVGWMNDAFYGKIQELGLSNKVHLIGFIDEPEKPALLRGADVFAYVSLYEGFGIPVLEAMACGALTLTSSISSMPEVAGDAAVLVNPTDVEAISNALSRLALDQELRTTLRVAGPARAALFTWERLAHQTLAIYDGFRS